MNEWIRTENCRVLPNVRAVCIETNCPLRQALGTLSIDNPTYEQSKDIFKRADLSVQPMGDMTIAYTVICQEGNLPGTNYAYCGKLAVFDQKWLEEHDKGSGGVL